MRFISSILVLAYIVVVNNAVVISNSTSTYTESPHSTTSYSTTSYSTTSYSTTSYSTAPCSTAPCSTIPYSTTLNSTTLNSTTLNSTTLNSTTLNSTTLNSTTLNSTTLNSTTSVNSDNSTSNNEINLISQIYSETITLVQTDPLKERTLVLFKPEVVHRGIIGSLLSEFEQKGFKIVAMKLLVATREQIELHYADHYGKGFYSSLVGRTANQPIVALVFEGLNAVTEVRRLMGLTNPQVSPLGTIRSKYGMQVERNLVHASDSIENANLEISVWFCESEVYAYERAIDKYIYFQE
ncbi:nucleoside diphosphate kinase family protein [Cryptosporidium muris RN66]|uniref:Nucleoside diphosphate kinase n=1 Tax=Cryptosporidium muris (strain RN66) TaxID=441375 RepID=B6A9T1_CRYMR|nr:nucleoside diphosphate kinase family protein [Cryptosporidium muris RN66]EEA04972.1 nucleoside diphosphate kinase family protein [Cryptosporidium muris RN66]|eukprot:XP_002139321.1 nucleoside diphosphate kinase family protein [Cryptosporidium muris RN66]